MAAEGLARGFEPFYTTKQIGKGSGLGLPQVQGFAEQSNGGVRIERVVDRGTTVTLPLPKTDQTPVAERGFSVTRTGSADAALGALADGRVVDRLFSDIMMSGAMNFDATIFRPGQGSLGRFGH